MILPQVHLRNGEALLADPDPIAGRARLYLRPRLCAATHRHLVCERHPGTGGRASGVGTWLRMAHFCPAPRHRAVCDRRCYHTQGRYPGRGRLVGEPLGGRLRCGLPRNLTVSPGGWGWTPPSRLAPSARSLFGPVAAGTLSGG